MAIENDLALEKPRTADSKYQSDRSEYNRIIKQIQHILSVRANHKTRQKLLGVKINIINRGRAEIFALQDAIYIDIALLDLLERYADELSVAEIKNDPLLHMEFNLSYAVALNGNKLLRYLDPYNTANLSKEQWSLLWNAKKRAEKIIFENTLGFMVAHEMSHLLLDHNTFIQKLFPDMDSRTANNPAWIRTRRGIELAADQLASKLCLDALFQPAQLLTWLSLNEIRRRYYGKSAEYPTSAQRIATINEVYYEAVGIENSVGDLRDAGPLAPHKDILQNNYHLGLDEFRNVRNFSQAFLVEIDNIIAEFLKQEASLKDIAEYIIFYIGVHKELLVSSKKPKSVDNLIELVKATDENSPLNKTLFISLLAEIDVSEKVTELFLQELDYEPIGTKAVLTYLDLLKTERSQYDLGLGYDYLLANTYFRWFPELFTEMIKSLPKSEIKARKLKPYVLGEPIIREPPSYIDKLNSLRVWNSEYLNPAGAD
ncbi:MAG: hypothetical protein QNL62_13905 [Gammaproteobacteria bacterium]|nr:hypothetical protein [Gammaproteobacteria bacterium]